MNKNFFLVLIVGGAAAWVMWHIDRYEGCFSNTQTLELALNQTRPVACNQADISFVDVSGDSPQIELDCGDGPRRVVLFGAGRRLRLPPVGRRDVEGHQRRQVEHARDAHLAGVAGETNRKGRRRSTVAGPKPRTRSSDSTSGNGPRVSRSAMIAEARAGPIPWSCSSAAWLAWFRSSGRPSVSAASLAPIST